MFAGWKTRDVYAQAERRACLEIQRLSAAMSVFIFLCLSGCAHRDPQAAYEHAQQTFRHGDVVMAAKEAEQGYRDFQKTSTEWAWKFTILRARILYQQGMYEDVLELIVSQPAAPSSADLAVRKCWLEGLANTSLGKFQQAEQKFVEAEGFCTASDSTACADVLTARGALEMRRGHYAQAQIFFERVLRYARASGDRIWEADALLDMSWSANEQTHFDNALDWSAAVRQISVERGVPDLTQAALGNMGWAYYKLGDTEKAEGMFLEARKQAEKLGNISDQVKWLLNVGYVYLDTRDFVLAEQSFRKSLDLAERIKSNEDIINALQSLAFVSEKTNKLEDAKRYADEALAMARADGNKRNELYPRLVQGRIAAQGHDIATAESAFHEVAQAPDSPVFLKWQAEHSLARLYESENQPDAAEREYETALSTFEEARANIRKMDSRLPFLANASAIYDDYIHFLVARGKTAQSLQVAEYSRARNLAEGLNLLKKGTSFAPAPLNAQQVARQDGSTILFYWLGEKQSYLWAITRQKTSLFFLPPESEIKAAVQRYGKALVGPQDVLDTANEDGRWLYHTLISPAHAMLAAQPSGAKAHLICRSCGTAEAVPFPGSASVEASPKVVIVPDSSLNSLNFETLLVSEPKLHYWIEDATITNVSSLRLLSATHKIGKNTPNLLIMGDAVSPSTDYPNLPKAAVEMDSIEKHFAPSQQQVFKREHASPPAYLASKPEQFSYIHFVAHGTASRLSPLDSAIVLSKATAADDSFKLYARDIVQHPLHAELVTISTCYGQGTRAFSGEGMVGLSWAFLRAGAHNVIGALWEVSDISTPQLMDQLYRELKKERTPDAALRSAKLSLLRSDSAFRRPFYWAPFQLYAGS